MMLARHQKAHVAWLLYFSILFGSLLCAMGHGQMAGLRLAGLDDAAWCSADSSGVFKGDQDTTDPVLSAGGDCVIASLFSATLLAVFFGLLALLARESSKPLPKQPTPAQAALATGQSPRVPRFASRVLTSPRPSAA